jgi:hypothetical protein
MMLKRYEAIGYGLAFVALCGFLLGWKIFVSPERPEETAELQKRLSVTANNISSPAASDNADDFLKYYAVNIAHTPPFKSRFIGYGIYLGQGIVLTAAHVVGRSSGYAHPHVLIAGLDLPATVLKQGSPEHTDLALLSVDPERLPISLQLRRNPLCKEPLQVGTRVIIVNTERTAQSQIISPLLIPQQFRSKYPTLIVEPQNSGSGVFDAERKCLIGIMSARVKKLAYQTDAGRTTLKDDGYAGYFVPVSKGATFIPPQYRF